MINPSTFVGLVLVGAGTAALFAIASSLREVVDILGKILEALTQ